MEREGKIQLLEDIAAKRVDPRTLVKKAIHFLLPANDGSDDVLVLTKYAKKRYTLKQFKRLEISKAWTGQQK